MKSKMLLQRKNYNPKIDYLVCKNLIESLPSKYDDLELKKCFYEEKEAILPYEKDIVCVYRYLKKVDIRHFQTIHFQEIYEVITKQSANMTFLEDIVLQNDEVVKQLEELCKHLEKTNLQKIIVLKLCLIYFHALKYGELMIPYWHLVKKLRNAIIHRQISNAHLFYNQLIADTNRFKTKHSLELNAQVVPTIRKYKEDFLKASGVVTIGIYGSFASNNANEYSDVDLLIVTEKNIDYQEIKKLSSNYWQGKINIPVDLKVVKQSEVDKELTIGMKKTLIMI